MGKIIITVVLFFSFDSQTVFNQDKRLKTINKYTPFYSTCTIKYRNTVLKENGFVK